MVDEPKNAEGVQNVTTPSSDAAITETPEQPVSTEPVKETNYQEELEKEKAKAERYKQQLQGREKQVEELQTQMLAKKFFAEPDETSAPQEGEKKPQEKEVNQKDAIRDQMLIKATLREIKEDLTQKYGNDKHVPFNAAEVQEKILEADPQGSSLLNPQIWEYMYKVVRGERLESITNKYEEDKKEIVDKEDSKMVNSTSVPTNSGNSEGDSLPFEKAIKVLSTDELQAKYPAEYLNMMTQSLGL